MPMEDQRRDDQSQGSRGSHTSPTFLKGKPRRATPLLRQCSLIYTNSNSNSSRSRVTCCYGVGAALILVLVLAVIFFKCFLSTVFVSRNIVYSLLRLLT